MSKRAIIAILLVAGIVSLNACSGNRNAGSATPARSALESSRQASNETREPINGRDHDADNPSNQHREARHDGYAGSGSTPFNGVYEEITWGIISDMLYNNGAGVLATTTKPPQKCYLFGRPKMGLNTCC